MKFWQKVGKITLRVFSVVMDPVAASNQARTFD